jgi:predicted nucleic acid-binding protein
LSFLELVVAAAPNSCSHIDIAEWRREILGIEEVIVGDLMLCEVLQGLESEQAAPDVEALLRRFEIVSMAGEAIAVAGARNYRFLRRRGITVRKQIDLLIGTWCIENRAPLLHNDSDFHPMTRHLGLREFTGRRR